MMCLVSSLEEITPEICIPVSAIIFGFQVF